MEKIGRWSEISVNSNPLTAQFVTSFVKILSISDAVFEVILVGREIKGKKARENMLNKVVYVLDSLMAGYYSLEASLPGQIFVLRTSNFRGATISRYSSPLNFLRFLLV